MEKQQALNKEMDSETSLKWDRRRIEGFREHMVIDGLSSRVSGRGAACGWAVERLDCDKEEERWYATYRTMLAKLMVSKGDQESSVVGSDWQMRMNWP